MEAYCLCCNSLVLDVRLVRTKANLYIPSDLCHIYVGYCGSIAVVELNLMDISGHLYSHVKVFGHFALNNLICSIAWSDSTCCQIVLYVVLFISCTAYGLLSRNGYLPTEQEFCMRWIEICWN